MIALESDRTRVEVDPAFGAPVTAVGDNRARRKWLVTGSREGDVSGAATLGAREARSWDGCFLPAAPPSIPPREGYAVMVASGGGWSTDVPVHQLALEPTTLPVDSIAPAQAEGLCNVSSSKTTQRWSVRADLLRPEADPA